MIIRTYFQRISVSVGLLAVFFGICLPLHSNDEARRVIIVANENVASSIEVAEYYADQRGIPKENIIQLPLSRAETITIEEYVRTLHNPLLARLLEDEWIKGIQAKGPDAIGRDRLTVGVHTISYLVTVAGVPLRIANNPELIESEKAQLPEQFQVNRGSVDGELALLPGPPNLSMTAFVPNPLFSQKNPTGPDAARVIRVSRLDGPSAAVIMNMIDRTLEAESQGLIGRAYFDIGGPHSKGDEWINEAGDLAVAAHFDADFETTRRPMDFRDRFDAPAIYMGWYRPHAYGPWAEEKWNVPPGAIGFHLHSFSATTVRSTSKAWLGAFVSQGYCAMVGNVYEPYLEFTHRPQMLLSALMEGRTFGDAAMYSNPALSWMGVAIGDPLYRPFKVGLDAQLAMGNEGLYGAYLTIRQINRLKADGKIDEALAFGRAEFIERPSLALAFALAKIHADRGESKQAVESLRIVRYVSDFDLDERVLVKQIADFLAERKEMDLAFDLYKKLNATTELDRLLKIDLLEDGAKIASEAGDRTTASQWTSAARQLKAPAAE